MVVKAYLESVYLAKRVLFQTKLLPSVKYSMS
jgi:hypothetical protein